ncbi:hypothetical protein I4F81_003624 [Pyropia yezoensis]|uniref:Uncharacterized protein n=1 Tax=Pyropia yezoensis TaxID=2788 RepID=A0ACC3BT40_PYRYE|nr:hypothetical protein I4F81_003624 [Neopyropia yezoensis]
MDLSLHAPPLDAPSPAAKSDPRRLGALRDWLAASGVAAPVRLVAPPDGTDVSLVAATELRPGDTAVHVPLRLAVTAEVAAVSPVGVAATAVAAATDGGLPALDAYARLYLYLIACRVVAVLGGGGGDNDGDGDATGGYPHAPYVATLPAAHDDPSHWTAEQVGWLAGTNLAAALPARLAALRAIFDAVVPPLTAARPDVFPPDVYTWGAWTWAVSAYTSRAFPARLAQLGGPAVRPLITPSGGGGGGVDSGGGTGTAAVADPPGLMLPLLDSCNHQLGSPVTWRTVTDDGDGGAGADDGPGLAASGTAGVPTAAATGAVELVVGYPVAAGAPVMNNYGPKANESLLMGYGFCLDGSAGAAAGGAAAAAAAPGGHYAYDVYPLKLAAAGGGVDPDDWARLSSALRREGLDGVHYLRHPQWRRGRQRAGEGGDDAPDNPTDGALNGTDGDGDGDDDGDLDDSGIIPTSVVRALALTMLAAGGVLWEVTSDAAQTAVIPPEIDGDPDFWADVAAELAGVLADRLARAGGAAAAAADAAELAASAVDVAELAAVAAEAAPPAGPPDGDGETGEAPPSWAEALERLRPDAAAAAARRRRAALLYRSSQRAILAAALARLRRRAAEVEAAATEEDGQAATDASDDEA